MEPQTQPRKTYTTADVIARFAAQGVAIDTMSRAMMVTADQVRGVCVRAKDAGVLAGVPPETNVTAADRKLALRMELVNLREQLADAEALVRELRQDSAAVNPNLFAYDRLVHLTACEMKVLSVLVTRGRVTKERLYFELYGDRNDKADPKIIDVYICKLRRKLAPMDVEIETRWGHGYEMRPEAIARLNELAGVQGALPRVDAPSLQAELQDMVA